MKRVSDETWKKYVDIINDAHEDFNQASVIWKRYKKTNDRFNEGKKDSYDDIVLKCLIQFNVFRVWPMTTETTAGALDEESIVIFLNNKYLTDLGYATSNRGFIFDPGMDIFEYMGQQYRASGETQVSQAKDITLHYIIILKRLPTESGKPKY